MTQHSSEAALSESEFDDLVDAALQLAEPFQTETTFVLYAAGYSTDRAFPHALRATAATWHSYRGVDAVPLQAMFGWADLTTAQKYIRLSGGATQEALRQTHADA